MREYQDEFKRILEASHNNTLTFFVGAGVSRVSEAPSWNELVKRISEKISWVQDNDKFSYDDLLRIPQIFYSKLCKIDKDKGEKEYYKFLDEHINKNGTLIPNEVHDRIFRLNPSTILTTNFDDLLEKASVKACKTCMSVACDKDVPGINGNRFILKVHGDIEHRNVVLKEEDYLGYSDNFKFIETLTKSIFATNTIVFIGYGLADYNINLIISWVKRLLGDRFIAPIFIYTDKKLNEDMIDYYRNIRSLFVIDCNDLIGDDLCDYKTKYLSFFDTLNKWLNYYYERITEKMILDEKISEIECFEVLYERLKPLDKFFTLRIQDIVRQLNSDVEIDESGCIHRRGVEKRLHPLFEFFCKMHNGDKSIANPDNYREKYLTIKNVLLKARVSCLGTIHNDRVRITLNNDRIGICDPNCIGFKYDWMRQYVSKDYDDIVSNFKKAFYLIKLFRFSECSEFLKSVIPEAFMKGEYVIYYISKLNLLMVTKCLARYSENKLDYTYELEHEMAELFTSMPSEFRNKYPLLRTFQGTNELYKFSYGVQRVSMKVNMVLDDNRAELGISSLETLIRNANDQLHFYLGNCIAEDVYSEYKNSFKVVMNTLLNKYSTQLKNKIRQYIEFSRPLPFIFDDVDFYCFVEFFDDQELISAFTSHGIDIIEFSDQEIISEQIRNIFEYYFYCLSSTTECNDWQQLFIRSKMQTLLALLKYIRLDEKIITSYLVPNMIKDKILGEPTLSRYVICFFDRLLQEHIFDSSKVNNILLEKVLEFHNYRMKNIPQDSPEAEYRFDYRVFVKYLNSKDSSDKIMCCIHDIVDNNILQMFDDITIYYRFVILKSDRIKLVKWVENVLSKEFNFDFFRDVVTSSYYCNFEVPSNLWSMLKKYFVQETDEVLDKFLPQVGFWCFINLVDRRDYSSYFGSNLLFDFFYDFEKFDYEKFNVSWLLEFDDFILSCISNNDYIKSHVRPLIVRSLQKGVIKKEHEHLNHILINYFC